MTRPMIAVAFCVMSWNVALAQPTNPLEGVWRISERVVPPGHPLTHGVEVRQTNPAPSLIIFTKGYYSEVYEMGGQPRLDFPPAKDPLKLTDEEKIARYEQWNPFTANAGTYEIKDSLLIRHPIVAKNVQVMTRKTQIPMVIKIQDANTVWLTPTADRASTEPRQKLTRVE